MLLIMDHTCDHFGRKTLQRAFDLICARLGISDYNREIRLSFNEPEFSASGKRVRTGDMAANPYELVAGKSPTEFIVHLARHVGFYKTISTFAHELVHVKQYILGELGARMDFSGTELVEQYMGCDAEGIRYDNKPWEVEAFAKMHDLAKHAILTMEREGVIKRK